MDGSSSTADQSPRPRNSESGSGVPTGWDNTQKKERRPKPAPEGKSEFQAMNRRDWVNSGLIIFGLLILAILVAQSRRNCEIPSSSWVPCIWGEPLKSNKGVVIYTLYRNSPTVIGTISGVDARIHVATFDAAKDHDYNKNNCESARDLFASQAGDTVRYWCERGNFTQ